MNSLARRAMSIMLAAGISGAELAAAQAIRKPDSPTAPGTATVEGLVRDISCAIQNLTASATRFNLECARQCAEHGSPLIILAEDGTLFVPISGSTPDSSQRERLLPFLGKYVRVTGAVFERAGTHAVAIDKIDEVKGMHLITDAQ
jgi:DNA/RNA endonuclease YhcR with UshA esterase domain